MHRTRNTRIPGPNIRQPFQVLTGIAVIFTEDYALPFPAGSAWPGKALPADLAEVLHPVSVELLPGTTTGDEVSSSGLEAGLILLRAVVLMKGPMGRRLAQLSPEVRDGAHQRTLAGALSTTREYLSQYLRKKNPL